jgi:hypothetical protein
MLVPAQSRKHAADRQTNKQTGNLRDPQVGDRPLTFSQVTSREVSMSRARWRSREESIMPAVRAPSNGSGDSQILRRSCCSLVTAL